MPKFPFPPYPNKFSLIKTQTPPEKIKKKKKKKKKKKGESPNYREYTYLCPVVRYQY